MNLRVMSVIIGVLSAAGIWVQAAEPTNLIKEPSFEGALQNSGLPAEWYGLHTNPGGSYRFEISNDVHSGQKSLMIAGEGKFGVVWGEKFKADRSKIYRARGWVKIVGDEPAAADVKLHYYGANQDYLGQSRVGFVTSRTPGWQLITVTDELDLFPKAEFLSIAVATTGKSRAWFDDVELTAVDGKRTGPLNFVANGNLEDVAADRPAGWHVLGNEGHKPTCRFDDKEQADGKLSLWIESSSEWAAASSVQAPLDQRLRRFGCSGHAKVKVQRGTAHISIAYFKNGQLLGHERGPEVTSHEWTSVTLGYNEKAHPDATHINVVLAVDGDSAAWFDGVRLESDAKAEVERKPEEVRKK